MRLSNEIGRSGRCLYRAGNITPWKCVGILLVVVTIGILSAISIRWVLFQRDAAKKSQLAGRFAQLKLALENYYDDNNGFPPLPKQLQTPANIRSWRVELLPYLDLGDIYKKYSLSKSWNGAPNRRLANSLRFAPDFFRSPYSANKASVFSDFLAVTQSDAATLSKQGLRTIKVTRGHDNFFVAELPNSAVHWMDPNDQIP